MDLLALLGRSCRLLLLLLQRSLPVRCLQWAADVFFDLAAPRCAQDPVGEERNRPTREVSDSRRSRASRTGRAATRLPSAGEGAGFRADTNNRPLARRPLARRRCLLGQLLCPPCVRLCDLPRKLGQGGAGQWRTSALLAVLLEQLNRPRLHRLQPQPEVVRAICLEDSPHLLRGLWKVFTFSRSAQAASSPDHPAT